MARRRIIDPSIWTDPDFGKLSPECQVFYISSFSNADDEGRLRAHPAYLKSLVFPYREITNEDMRIIRDATASVMRNMVLYRVNDEDYIQHKNWPKYQIQRSDRIVKSIIPPTTAGERMTTCLPFGGHSAAEVKGSKEKGSKENKNQATQSVASEKTLELFSGLGNVSQVNELMELFRPINPTVNRLFANKSERAALERLVQQFGREVIERAIRILPAIVSRPFAPSITKPTALERDWGKLVLFMKKEKARESKFKAGEVNV